MSPTDTPPRIELRGVAKTYGAVRAVDGASLSIARGCVHALVGANGAGKSTLGKMIAGAIPVDDGEIALNGEAVRWTSPRDALGHGVAFIAQELALVPDMTVLENVFLGAETARAYWVDRGSLRARFTEVLAGSGFEVPADAPVRSLAIADQQKVEIIRALSRDADVIVMDEPTSSLTHDEVRRLHAVIRGLRSAGKTVVYVSHFLDEVLDLADVVTILRNGRVVRTSPIADETETSLVMGMLGHAAAAEYPERNPVEGHDAILEVRNLSRGDQLHDVSLAIRRGEIVGLAGLVGSGRSELLRAIFGADRADHGTVTLSGHRLTPPAPHTALRAGMALLPESRKEQGLVMEQSAAANTTLAFLRTANGISQGGWVRRRKEREQVRDLLAQMTVKPASPDARVKTMSGGNQQKVLFGKCLFRNPQVLLLDEPTRGVDVAARGAIHELIGQLAARGVAILLVSSDLDEVLGLSHRILVMRRGTIVDDFPADVSMDVVMEAALGVTADSGRQD